MLEKDENLGIIIQMGLSNIVNMFMIKSAVTDLRHELVPAEERGQRESDGERPDECEQNVNLKKIPRFSWCSRFITSKDEEVSRTDTSTFFKGESSLVEP